MRQVKVLQHRSVPDYFFNSDKKSTTTSKPTTDYDFDGFDELEDEDDLDYDESYSFLPQYVSLFYW